MILTEKDKKAVLERFLRYVQIWTTSDGERADQGIQPSSDRQWDFAHLLEKELKSIGLESVQISSHCYVYGFLPPSPGKEGAEAFCLLAHMDTVDEVSGEHVKPQLKEKDGDTIITSDGTTLLGADDKAGVTAIMSALSFLQEHPEIPHGKIEVIFSPDEETGHGMDNVPLNLITSKCAYTVDGGSKGELETECFNAFKSEITFTGKATHTGTARAEGMVNAAVMASSFVANLPRHQAPETSDGYQGFYAVMDIKGGIEKASLTLLLRDFSTDGMEERKAFVDALAKTTAASFGGKAEVVHTQQYLNMKEGLKKVPRVTENLVAAYRASGIEPVFTPIRGGTDGSRLTEMGIPTPNIFTGGHNFHSRDEWCSLNELSSACEVLINLARIFAEN